MARRRGRTGARVGRSNGGRTTSRDGSPAASVVPRVILGAVSGVEIVAVGALQFTRDVLLSAVSGAANIGAEALNATVTGARGVVAAASRMVGDIAGTAQGTFQEAVYNARHARPGAARVALRRPALPVEGGPGEAKGPVAAPSRRRAKRRRTAARNGRTRVAA
jgi:hypothetical protein